MNYTSNEIIDKNGVHTNHFEIWEINGSKKVKVATAFYKANANKIVKALNNEDKI